MQRQMNPATLLRLANGLRQGGRSRKGVHILRLAAESGCWTSTIYLAEKLGYLHKTETAHFTGTIALWREVKQAERVINQRRRAG